MSEKELRSDSTPPDCPGGSPSAHPAGEGADANAAPAPEVHEHDDAGIGRYNFYYEES